MCVLPGRQLSAPVLLIPEKPKHTDEQPENVHVRTHTHTHTRTHTHTHTAHHSRFLYEGRPRLLSFLLLLLLLLLVTVRALHLGDDLGVGLCVLYPLEINRTWLRDSAVLYATNTLEAV